MSKKKKKSKKKISEKPKERNFIAIAAHFHSGAGSHKDKKKEKSKKACRKKIRPFLFCAKRTPLGGLKKLSKKFAFFIDNFKKRDYNIYTRLMK